MQQCPGAYARSLLWVRGVGGAAARLAAGAGDAVLTGQALNHPPESADCSSGTGIQLCLHRK